jgi:hypothetical protein
MTPKSRYSRCIAVAAAILAMLVACATSNSETMGDETDAYSWLFPEPTGVEAQLIANAPASPLEPLSDFGPQVSDALAEAYQAAAGYDEAGRLAEAAQLGGYAMRLAAKQGETLSLLQVERLVAVRALAVADGGDPDLAADLYDLRVDVIADQNDWESRLPPGIEVRREYDEQLAYVLRSMAHRDRAIMNSARPGHAVEMLADLERAVLFSVAVGRPDAVRIQRRVISNVVGTQQFEGALAAVETRLDEISDNQESFVEEVFIAILRVGAVSAVNLDDLPRALEYYQLIIEVAEMSGYTDSLLENDRRATKLIKEELRRRG